MIIDTVNSLTRVQVIYPVGQATSTLNSPAIDLQSYDFVGVPQLICSCGPKSAGDANPTWNAYFLSGADTNIANATNLNIAITQVTNSNNVQSVAMDIRAVPNRYLFAKSVVAGVNGVVPVSIVLEGTKKVQ
jgi:hypothetical protein